MGFRTGASDGSGVERLRITSGGNIGIGTASPESRLHVGVSSDTLNRGADQLSVFSSAADHFNVARFSSNHSTPVTLSIGVNQTNGYTELQSWTSGVTMAGTLVLQARGGNVGIGTTQPSQKLEVRGNVLLETGGDPVLYTGVGANEFRRYLQLINSPTVTSASGLKAGGALIADDYGYANPAKNDLVVKGNVGVGTNAPASKLHVIGNITVDGNINAKYQDVAEWVPSTQKLAAGTVVILDTGRDNHVLASKGAYDTRVAGVISAQPGLSLGEAGEGKVLVATTGRVKVRVDATRAPIKIGDLIVTSEVEGVAMKSVPVELGGVALHRPGTLIGKALESLEKGTGEILVLLSLQ
jgi:hypothetical protein